MKILIVEDDPLITEFLKLGLGNEGFEILLDADGRSAATLVSQNKPALIILDLGLPGADGADLCKRLRSATDAPILVVTCHDELKDKVLLLTLGADDYVVKPFNFEELLARIRALLRRSGSQAPIEVRFLDILVRPNTREVYRGSQSVELTMKEFDLLSLFLRNPRQVLSKETILQKVWGYGYEGDSNTIEVYVGHLRRKLGEPQVIQTVRGVGYSLRTLPETA